MVASKEYKQDKIKTVAQDSHKCCTGTLYSGNSQYVDTHISYRTISVFLQLFTFYSSIFCERVHVWSHWHTATYFIQECCNKAMWYWKEQFH